MGRLIAALLGLLLFGSGPAELLIRAQLPQRAHECTCNEVVCRCGHRPAPLAPRNCHEEAPATLRSCNAADSDDEAAATSAYVLPMVPSLPAPWALGPARPRLERRAQPPILEVLAPPPKPSLT